MPPGSVFLPGGAASSVSTALPSGAASSGSSALPSGAASSGSSALPSGGIGSTASILDKQALEAFPRPLIEPNQGQSSALTDLRRGPSWPCVGFCHVPQPWAYQEAVTAMQTHAACVAQGLADEQIWLLEHPCVYTAGRRALASECQALQEAGLPLVLCSRGGRLTYHGPGQRIVYAMIDLRRRSLGVTEYVSGLEDWGIGVLAGLGIEAFRSPPHTGLWTRDGKIAALGVHVQRGITMHGFALNVGQQVQDGFSKIAPCGLKAPIASIMQMNPGLGPDQAALFQKVDRLLFETCPFL
jgi:lipoyl(octanoyl) transferase